jgi:hypothetical protein
MTTISIIIKFENKKQMRKYKLFNKKNLHLVTESSHLVLIQENGGKYRDNRNYN